MKRLILISAVVMSCGLAVAAQQPPVQGRDRAQLPTQPATVQRGSGSVSGVVVTADDTAAPLAYVPVALAVSQLGMPRVVLTDAEGRFRFEEIADGSYFLNAQKPAWVTVRTGMRSIAGQSLGIPISVSGGEAVTGVRLRLHKGGVLAGTVTLPGGRAGAGLQVTALAVRVADGQRQTSMLALTATTDDQGRYRVYGLPPADYVVQVRQLMLPQQNLDMRRTLPSDIRWAESVLAGPSNIPGAVPDVAPPPGPTVAFSPTYFPSSATLTGASVVSLGIAEERTGIDIGVQLVPTAEVTGTVTSLEGTPAGGAMVALQLPPSAGQEELLAILLGSAVASTAADGTFTLRGVMPGSYELQVRAAPPGARGSAAMSPMVLQGIMGGAAAGGATRWARQTIEVNGSPVGPLALQLREGLRVTGKVVLEGSTTTLPRNARVLIGSTGTLGGLPDVAMFRPAQSTATVAADGTFEAAGLMPGTYRVSVVMPGMRTMATEPGSGWMLKSVEVNDRDVADLGLDVGAGDVEGMTITLTDRPSELTGQVQVGDEAAAAQYQVVVFSTDRTYWRTGSRRVMSAQPSSDGRFVLAGLPAGDYHLAVVTDLDTRELASQTFLESLIASAIPVTMAEGERKRQDIRIR
jgi:hypothetical protein